MMHRTQIYFEEDLFAQVKSAAQKTDLSLSAYIRGVLKKELAEEKTNYQKLDLSSFSDLWQDRDITQQQLRSAAWK